MFGVLIAGHEAGHFGVAKLFGIRVNEFSVGMGPALLSRQKGETRYSLRLLPFGGYCAIEGEDGESEDPRAFSKKPLLCRLGVLAAGSAANLLIGFLIALIIYFGYGLSGRYSVANTTLAGFMEGFPLESSDGLLEGDRIVSVNGWRVHSTRDFSLFMSVNTEDTVDLVIRRDGQRITLEDFPLTLREYSDGSGNTVLRYGLYFCSEPLTVFTAVREALWDCAYYARVVWVSLGCLLNGQAGLNDLSGPVGMVKAIGEAGADAESVSEGLGNVFTLIAFIAVNLAVMNLLPLPALDGGHIFSALLLAAMEKLFHRKPNPKIENAVHAVGLFLLLGLMVFVMANDIRKLF